MWRRKEYGERMMGEDFRMMLRERLMRFGKSGMRFMVVRG